MTDLLMLLELDLSPGQLFGYLASALVLATFAMRSMQRLRCLAILSNIAFIYYAGALGLAPIFILHVILLPLNLWRLIEVRGARPGSHHEDARDTTTGPPVTDASGSGTAGPFIIAASHGERPHRAKDVQARSLGGVTVLSFAYPVRTLIPAFAAIQPDR